MGCPAPAVEAFCARPVVAAEAQIGLRNDPSAIWEWVWCLVAPIVDLALPERDAEDGKNHEEEDCQAKDATKMRERVDQGSDQEPHRWHGRQAPQGPEEPECSQPRYVLHGGQNFENGGDHDREVKPVPRVIEVALAANAESHGNRLGNELAEEDDEEHVLRLLNENIGPRIVSADRVVLDAEEEGVEQDHRSDEVVELRTRDEPDQEDAQLVLVLEDRVRPPAVLHVLAVRVESGLVLDLRQLLLVFFAPLLHAVLGLLVVLVCDAREMRRLLALLLAASARSQVGHVDNLRLELRLKRVRLRRALLLPFLPDLGVPVPLANFLLPDLLRVVELHPLLEDVLQAREPGDGILAVLVELVHVRVLVHLDPPEVLGVLLLLGLLVEVRLQFVFVLGVLLHLRMAGR